MDKAEIGSKLVMGRKWTGNEWIRRRRAWMGMGRVQTGMGKIRNEQIGFIISKTRIWKK